MPHNLHFTLPLLMTLALACSEPGKRVVTIGDNVGANPTYRTSYIGLLTENDDALFPEFSGASLATLYGGEVEIVRFDRGGDSYHNLALEDAPFCTCAGASCEDATGPCLDTEHEGETVVVVQLGGNDLLNAAIRLVNSESLRADPEPLLASFPDDIRAVLALVRDEALFPVRARVLVTNVYDPSDGVGDLAAIAAGLLPPGFGLDPSVVTEALALGVLGAFNAAVAAEAGAIGAELVDAHAHFLGHGYHHDDAEHANYRAEDPTDWLRGAFDPTLRGAHELRRLIWNQLSGDARTALPPPLPPASILDLPAVPDDGWAKVLVDAKITESLRSDELDIDFPNTLADAEQVLGAPTGNSDDSVAIGIIGSYVVVDLGEGTQAMDGPGEDLVVLEFGATSGGVPEPYRVSVASEANGPFLPVADARGERAFDLGEAGIRSARYVKVESLASAVDILGGLGSATAPGPELDAIGAVHPGAP